jgi:ferritin-like metal-binding protein YciE
MNQEQLTELLLQSLEHEKGGVQVYEAALRCVQNDDLREEWEEYLEQTRTHVQILQNVCERFEIDTEEPTPGCEVIQHMGASLVKAITMASGSGNPEAAQLVACECVVLAETKDHLDWELIGKCAEHLSGDKAKALESACEEVEEQEDEHLYHTKGWCRELWLQSLGLKAMLPPPEERKDVKTAIGAARAQQESERSR